MGRARRRAADERPDAVDLSVRPVGSVGRPRRARARAYAWGGAQRRISAPEASRIVGQGHFTACAKRLRAEHRQPRAARRFSEQFRLWRRKSRSCQCTSSPPTGRRRRDSRLNAPRPPPGPAKAHAVSAVPRAGARSGRASEAPTRRCRGAASRANRISPLAPRRPSASPPCATIQAMTASMSAPSARMAARSMTVPPEG
jgi:hypothetical protein